MADTATNTVHVTAADFDKTVQEAGMPVLVDFYATWCGPCQQAAPILEKLAEENKGKVVIAKIDVDENPQIAQKYNVRSIPTVIMFKDAADLEKGGERQIGFTGRSMYENMINKVAGDTSAAKVVGSISPTDTAKAA